MWPRSVSEVRAASFGTAAHQPRPSPARRRLRAKVGLV
jgi:hypothetical protein